MYQLCLKFSFIKLFQYLYLMDKTIMIIRIPVFDEGGKITNKITSGMEITYYLKYCFKKLG